MMLKVFAILSILIALQEFHVQSYIVKASVFSRSQVKQLVQPIVHPKYPRGTTLSMTDRSSANWFQVGDTVRVVESVPKGQVDLKGRVGTVIETWEKCDVDPTCCCAEFVDDSFAVRVRFGKRHENEKEDNSLELKDYQEQEFKHYFAEREIVKVS